MACSAPSVVVNSFMLILHLEPASSVQLSMGLLSTRTKASLTYLLCIQVVMDARLVMSVLDSTQGLGKTGETLLVGPASSSNSFSSDVMASTAALKRPQVEVRYVVPLNRTFEDRHPDHVHGTTNAPFNASTFPSIYNALAKADSRSVDLIP